MKIFSTIRFKIVFLIVTFVIASITVSSWYFYLSYSKLMRQEIKKRGEDIVENLAYTSREGLRTKNLFNELEPLVLITRVLPDVVYVMFVDETGRVLAHSDPKEVGKVYGADFSKKMFKSMKSGLIHVGDTFIFGKVIEEEKKETLLFPEERVSGTIFVGISLKTMHTKIIAVLKNIILVAVILIILGIIFALVFSTRITNPIYKLSAAAVTIGTGDLTKRVEIETKDEIGELADFFNRMMDNLQQMTVSRDELIDELKAVNKELDSFVYTASHDLKEPLRGMETFSKFVLDDYSAQLDDTGKDYLKRISADAQRMRNLIDDLLSLSMITRIKNPYKSVDAGQLVKEAVKRLAPIIEEKNVQIRVDDELPFIFCDEVKVKEVFYNLILNAIKYSDNKEPVVEVGIKDETFFVKDNGIGIKKEHFDLIFQLFKRLHGRGEYGGGTGAGLAIVKKIIEEHRGKIWVESEEGKGSTFFFSIPKKLQGGSR